MPVRLMLGDEALAQGAIDAGIGGVFSYPGTPATEIFEYVENVAGGERGAVAARWSANEKVAYEEALGASYVGRRALVSMKHVGLNVAADPFVNSALTGVSGGLVLAVADDPGMHSSQNEQDSRFYGELAQVPVFEPATQQEAYDLTLRAFDYSEEIGLPVMVRLVTRLAHSRANVVLRPPEETDAASDAVRPWADPSDFTLVPANARRRYRRLVELQKRLLTPMATDEVYEGAIRVLLESDEVDAVVVGIVPLTAALETAPDELEAEGSLAERLPRLFAEAQKPLVAVVDSGPRYVPLVTAARRGGVPVFPSADQAVRSLGRYLCHRTASGP